MVFDESAVVVGRIDARWKKRATAPVNFILDVGVWGLWQDLEVLGSRRKSLIEDLMPVNR
jgi:hypothetical protein